MSMKAAIVAIVVAQIVVMATMQVCRSRGLWTSRRSAGFAVFGLEVVFVSLSLWIAGLI